MTQVPAAFVPCPLCSGSNVRPRLVARDRFHSRQELYTLMGCETCSLVWLANPPQGDQMAAHYTRAYHATITRAAESSASRWKAFRQRLLERKQSGALLDIGCSSGSFLETFQGTPWQLYGIEIAENVAARARQRTGAEVFVGDVADAPFGPNSFDAITSIDVLEHLERPREVIQRIATWLKPGGVFYIFVPNIRCWEARMFRSYWFGLEAPRHLYHYSPRSLRRLMSSQGLTEEWLVTPPLNYIEYSTRYVVDDIASLAGFSRTPLAVARVPGIVFRLARKALRLSVFSLFGKVASLALAAPAIEAMFSKDR